MLVVEKEQLSLFEKSTPWNFNKDNLFYNYSLDKYSHDVEKYGLSIVWDNICSYITNNQKNLPVILNIDNLGQLYEEGLAIQDKLLKKKSGQYFTPDDVANVMCKWLQKCEGENICDVGCATGNLILKYLDIVGYEKAKTLIAEGKIYLYDNDETALKICKTIIGIKYGQDLTEKININCCDFLNKEISLPKNSKVISNPPYSKISKISQNWENSDIISDTKEFYSAFMEKIFNQCNSAVIISPYSFISGNKFYKLRTLMSEYGGEIFSFDNVPGNIFYGKKHGIFNSNTSNSVRAAITVFNKTSKGYRLTPLIRFKNIERKELLNNDVLEKFLCTEIQTVNLKNTMFFKCDKTLIDIFKIWNKKSKGVTLENYTKSNGNFSISMPNTCRYYTTASSSVMNRNGQITLYFDDKDFYHFIYCFINSSFAYWHWRLYDGGITYTKNLLLNMPVFYNLLKDDDKKFFDKLYKEMQEKTKDFIVTKNNVGIQENIKFPRIYRDKINSKLLKILDIKEDEKIFDVIHSNMALKVNV